ncbi:hypothetical protein LR48_Vigan05g001900 [Vigna angularis]|uniref:Uncharacterized protein n=1 Tax=Phaseolus angularis TaxID=3914 RepID=A0A0L9UHN6_PHAAN|nr:hypothetical protein LR48_Vigan05g001900 [Vigna angularis]
MARDNVLTRVATGAAVGGAIGGAVGEITPLILCLVTSFSFLIFDVETLQVPGFLKIRHIGQTTLGSAAVFSLFLAAGTLIRSH